VYEKDTQLSITRPRPTTSTRLIANRDFVRLWVGQVGLALGNGVTLIAMPLLVLALTDSPVQAGIVAAARTLPYLVLGLPAGALVDRWDRRWVLIWCDLARALAVGSVPLAWSLGVLTVTQLVVVPLVYGAAISFSNIAQVAALPRLVTREQLAAAQAFNTSSLGVAALIGPGVGGIIIGLGRSTAEGAAIAFLVDAVANLTDLALIATIRRPFQVARPTGARRLHDEIVVGVRYLWSDRSIRLLAIVNMVHRVCVGSVVVLAVVVLGRDVLGADPAVLGLIVGAAGVGGLLGSVVTPRLQRRYKVGGLMVTTLTLHGLGIGLVGLAASVPLAMVGMVFVGAAEAMTSIIQVAYRLGVIPDRLQGRVNSVYRLGSFTAMTLGVSVVGLLVEGLGARTALWMMAAYVLITAVGVARSGVRQLS
jgi:MFS family permease